MHYPFISEKHDFQNGLDKLHLPKWAPGMANICSQLQDTIFKPLISQSDEEIHLQCRFPANSLYIPVPIPLLRVDFQNGDHILVPDVMWVPREEFFEVSDDDEVSGQVIETSPSADEIQDELSPAKIIQKTSLFVLQYKNYISVLQLGLETITLPLLEEQSLATRQENPESWAADQDEIRQLKTELCLETNTLPLLEEQSLDTKRENPGLWPDHLNVIRQRLEEQSFATKQKNLDIALDHCIRQLPEEQSLAKRRENPGSWAAHQDAIQQLKAELLKLATRIDAELFEYSTQRDPYFPWREWNELDQFKKTIETLLHQLNSDSIWQHLQSLNNELSSHAVLADIIGLRREVADDIFKEPSAHESEEDVIHRYFDAVANSLGTKLHNQPIQEQLVSLGYTEQRATFIANKIRCNKLPKHHLSVLDFAHIFIQDLFKYDVLLTDEVADLRLPDRSKGFNTVYNVKTGGSEEEREIQCQNFSSSKQDSKNLQSFFTADNHSNQSKESEDNFEYWYHGTDSFGACSILWEGIDLHEGARRKDFSDGKGFYMSDGYDHAREWTQKRFTIQNTSAILQFKVPKSFWDDHKDGVVLCIENEDGMQQWRDIIRYNRSKKKDAKHLKNLLMQVPFIMGPLSNDGLWIKKQNDPGWPIPLNSSWRQLCICNELVGVEFDMFLDKIAFVDN